MKTTSKQNLIAAALIGALAIATAQPSAVAANKPITAEEAHAIGVEAYVYFYPLLSMDITRKQFTNIEPGKEFGKGPMNTFVSVPEYPPADFKGVVRSNFDTLYSSAWLDLTKEPLIISAPDTAGRYYLLPMLDMWTDVFASPGWRTTGTQAGHFLVTPPGWTGTVPEGFTRIAAPTPYLWIIGRTKTDGPADYAAVHKIQAGYKVTPLSRWGKAAEPVAVKIDPTVDMKTPPKVQVDTLSADKYFTYAAELLKLHPPHITDEPIIARLKRLGFEAGKSLEFEKLDPAVQKALTSVPAEAQKLMAWKIPTLARVVNGWSMNTDTMGVYGTYYLKRAIVSQVGLGANLPEDAIYPLNLGDADGKPLDGANKYTIHFDKANLPPVGAFWSITLYDSDGFQVANALNRFAVSSWMPFKYNADGSLDLYFQNESPGKNNEANWLPAPKAPFNLTMRLYSPLPDALTGKWNPPPVKITTALDDGANAHNKSVSVLADGVGAKVKHVEGLHKVRFIEIFLAYRDAKTGKLVAGCYNSMFTSVGIPASKDTTPNELAARIDFAKVKQEYGVLGASLNGPKLMLPDWVDNDAGVERDFNGIKTAWVAQLDMGNNAGGVSESTPYKPMAITRNTVMGWKKGTTVLILDDAEGNAWVMKGFQLGLKPQYTYEEFVAAGQSQFKKLPPGWKFRVKKLEQDLIEKPEGGVAAIMPDEFFNVYDKAGPGMTNYKP